MSKRAKPPITRDVAGLVAFVSSRQRMPHAWGSDANDCIAFVAGAVEAQTGRSALGKLKWSGKTGALRLLARLGGIEAALDARFERIAPAHAHRGDIAGVAASAMLGLDADELALIGLHPMIVEGETLASPGERGLARCRRGAMVVAWNVMARKRSPSPQPLSRKRARGEGAADAAKRQAR